MMRLWFTLLWLAVSVGSAAATPRLLVVSKQKKTLESYDPSTYKLQFSVPIPGEPHEVAAAPDGRYAYVGDFGGVPNTLSIVDLNDPGTPTALKLDPFYKPHGMAITKDGKKLYVTCEASRCVVEVDLVARKVLRSFKLDIMNSHMLALSPDEKLLLVTSQWDGNVMIVDIEKGILERTFATGKGAEGVAVSPDGKEAWVVNRTVQSLAIIDIPGRKRVHKMSCEFNPMRAAMTPDGSLVIITSAMSDELALVDRSQREIVGRIKTGGDFPLGLAVSQDGSRVYVTNMNSANVSVVDLGKRETIHVFEVGGEPEGIALVE
jgi:YVTN family beta-propeller protein